jgi:hypothetical protein
MDYFDEKLIVSFRGNCFGVGLKQRGKNDKHICFVILVEDDESWFISKDDASTYWLPELMSMMQDALNWLDKNAIKTEDGYERKE